MKPATLRFADFLSRHFRTDMRFFLSGGFWLTVLQVVTLLGGLATTIIYTRLLDPSTYGTYKYIIALGVLLSSFTLSGITQSIQQATIKGEDGFFQFAMQKSLLFSFGIFVSALAVGCYYFFQGELTLALGCFLTAIFVPLTTTYQNVMYYLFGRKRFKTVSLFQGFDVIVSSLIIITTLIFTHNLLILLFVYLLLQFLSNFLADRLYAPRHPAPIPVAVTKKYYAYAWHTTARNTLFNVAFRLDNIIVFTHLGATDLAIYSIANLIPEQIKGSFKNLSSLLLVRYAKHDNLTIIRKTIWKRSLQMLLILVAITILYILITPIIYHLLFPKYANAIIYSQLAGLSFPAFVAIIPTSALQAQLKERELHLLNLINSISLLLFVTFGTYIFGIAGAIFARVLYRYVNMIASYLLLQN